MYSPRIERLLEREDELRARQGLDPDPDYMRASLYSPSKYYSPRRSMSRSFYNEPSTRSPYRPYSSRLDDLDHELRMIRLERLRREAEELRQRSEEALARAEYTLRSSSYSRPAYLGGGEYYSPYKSPSRSLRASLSDMEYENYLLSTDRKRRSYY
mgnify:CR=1 FL=1